MNNFNMLSTEPKPTSTTHGSLKSLDTLTWDTGEKFEYRGTVWVQTHAATGAAIVAELSPVFSEDRYVEYAQNATTPADNAVVWTSPDLTGYSVHKFHCTGGSISVQGDIHGDGTQWIGDLTGRDLLSTATATFVATIPTNGIFEIAGNYRNLRVLSNNVTPTTVVCRSIHTNGAIHG